MSNDVPWYVHALVAWLPFVMICGAMVWHGRQIRRSMTTRDGRPLAQIFAGG